MEKGDSRNKNAAGGSPGAATRPGPPSFQLAPGTRIKRTLAVMSGKGGVGKSAVATMLASELRRMGQEVGLLDADITGPSIPKGLGITGDVLVSPEGGAIPATSPSGIKVMSMNLILPSEEDAVIWRGPLVSGAVRQFYEQSEWGELDDLVIDLPPGTSDVPLTIMQSIELDGIVLVTSPQELVGTIVSKAKKMASALDAQVLGMVENMSYVICPSCGERISPFGESHAEKVSKAMDTQLLGRLPLDPRISILADEGRLGEYESEEISGIVRRLLEAMPTGGTAG